MSKWLIAVGLGVLFIATISNCAKPNAIITPKEKPDKWIKNFNLDKRNFVSKGSNTYFILEPGFQLVLTGQEGDEYVTLTITVLDETKQIEGIETRIVEERETAGDELKEISRNFYAMDNQTKDIFYFGEEVDIYKDGKIVSHSGAWLHGARNAKAGLMMPGCVRTGDKYYQEVAPGIAMDRAEIVSDNETLQTPAGKFDKCLKTEETSPLEPDTKGYKLYAKDIGLIKDGVLLLTKYEVKATH